jgi:hypothetical protein
MKRALKISVLIIVYLFFCGKSCQEDQEDLVMKQVKEAEILKENIRQEFGADYLTEESRYATELAAMQKVNDLADYIEIYADASLDAVFRQKAGEMIRDIFVSEDVHMSFGPYRNKRIKYMTVRKFLDKGFGAGITSAEVFYDSVRIEIPLSRSKPEKYEGTIWALQKITLFNASDTLASDEARITISIQASQKTKIFGKDTLKTWAVNLGDMSVNK